MKEVEKGGRGSKYRIDGTCKKLKDRDVYKPNYLH